MCGIIGYVGEGNVGKILHTGLSNLEYRGYDSAGIALIDDGLWVTKRSGTIDSLAVPDRPSASCGIGHTRWSTHGPPTDANAHPHTDCSGTLAVVHNGIIDNHESLRDELSDHTFRSETDTEVIPHLLEELRERGLSLPAAVQRVDSRLSGSYAICVVDSADDRLVVARHGNPLVVGRDVNGSFVGSDVTAFLDHTREVQYLQNGDVAVLTPTEVSIVNEGTPVDRPIETANWEAEAAQKGGYDHYMRKEIHEQPSALRQAIAGRLDTASGDVDLGLSTTQDALAVCDEIQLVACGTSAYAARYAARLLASLASVRATVEIASEYRFPAGSTPEKTLVIAVTQSGETADTLGALRRASDAGAWTLAVTNTLGSTVTREADETVFIRAGPEIGVAATKTFASQVATLAMIAVSAGRTRNALTGAEAREVLSNLRSLPGAIQQVLDTESTVRPVAESYADSEAFFFIGRALGVPVALEGALKLKEIAYDHAEGFVAGELKHGPLALVTEETPVIAVLTEGARAAQTVTTLTEAQTRGAPAIGCVSAAVRAPTIDERFEVPPLGRFEPLVANVYFQLFAYHVANTKGRSIDKPRNLAKSVTVE